MSLPYFNMYPTDFEADTSHLTLAEDGAYNRLLRLMWMTPTCTLPDDDAWIKRRMRCTDDEFETVVRVVINEFFKRENGRLSNARLASEFEKSNTSHKRRVSSGSKGGKAKAAKTNNKVSSNAVAMPKQPEPEPEPLEKEETKVSSQKPPRRKSRIPEDAVLTDKQREAAKKRGLSEQEAEAQFDRFKNNALANGRTYVDWDRAFVTWLDSPYFKLISPAPFSANGGRNVTNNNNQPASNRRPHRTDPALKQIARLAGLEEAPGYGGA